jgi:uncharacterized protein with von Willebrand factor type A (vWA) domain
MNVYILLDRSGSMQNLWSEAVGSINAYVEKLPKETDVYMAVFDNEYEVVRQSKAGSWKPIGETEVSPRGMTALYDASARIMQRAIDDNADRTIVLIMTDGEENTSRNFKHADVLALTTKIDAKKWELIFLGANFDNVKDVAASYGRSSDKFSNVSKDNMREFLSTTVACGSTQYATMDTAISFSLADKAAAVANLTPGAQGATK